MSKMAKEVSKKKEKNKEKNNQVLNFMGGINYELNPIETLKMVSASSIFGEPQYYRDGEFADKSAHKDNVFSLNSVFEDYSIMAYDKYHGMKTSALMEMLIDEALDYDYAGVLEWAKTLRSDFLMRLNPQVIMVRAALHPKRTQFTEKHPGVFHATNMEVMQRADDVINQITYYLYTNKGKEKVPGILKKSWAKKLSNLRRYEIAKYKNSGIGMIDAVRISHATSPVISELMQNGNIEVSGNELTWEKMRSNGKEWVDIIKAIHMPHMALLRNLRGILSETTDKNLIDAVFTNLKEGVPNGKQFPFRYFSAYNAINSDSCKVNKENKEKAKEELEKCMDIACMNMPKLPGKNAFLSDNSCSATCTFNSEYGSVRIADIDNLSSVIGAVNSEEGILVPFGDDMEKIKVEHGDNILNQTRKMRNVGSKLGGATESGIWKFFMEALGIDKNGNYTGKTIKYDNICIFSDMQAGTGGLYGTDEDRLIYKKLGFGCKESFGSVYINVAKLVDTYREKVNPKVNVYMIQTAGYNNVCVPGSGYRTSILYGWTGKELVYMDAMNKFWDECDANRGL